MAVCKIKQRFLALKRRSVCLGQMLDVTHLKWAVGKEMMSWSKSEGFVVQMGEICWIGKKKRRIIVWRVDEVRIGESCVWRIVEDVGAADIKVTSWRGGGGA